MKKTAIVLGFLLLPCVAHAQIGAPVTPGGVSVDGDGVLRASSTKPDPRLAELWKKAQSQKRDGQLLFVSLPRLFAEAQKHAGGEMPADIRYVGGMVKIQYVFVYPDEKDIVIAGPAEPFDTEVGFRPLGKYTGRPALQLDDLVTALRTCGPGRKGTSLGCDLQMTQEIADRIKAKTKELAPQVQNGKISAARASDLIAEAAGHQPVQFFGVDTNTRCAFVCIEADYQLKQIMLGIFDVPVRGMKSYNELCTKPAPAHRFVLESNLDHLVGSPDGRAYEFKGNALTLGSGRVMVEKGESEEISAAAKGFIARVNERMDEIQKHVVSWADLANLADLAVLAALIGEEKLQGAIGWDLSWVMNEYRVPEVRTPKSAQTLTVYRQYGGQTIFGSGGVLFEPVACVKQRSKDEVKATGSRPAGWK
jgi:hypothetical protein